MHTKKSTKLAQTFWAAAFSLTMAFSAPVEAASKRPEHGESTPKAFIVMDPYTQTVYSHNNPKKIWITASLNKAMTLHLLFDHMRNNDENMDATLVISDKAVRYLKGYSASLLHAKAGDVLTYDQAARAIIAKSAGDVSYAIAEHVSGSHDAFVKRMNETAKSWGMHKTIFADASGFAKRPSRYKPRAYSTSTACDMAIMMTRIMGSHPSLYSHYFSATDYEHNGKTHHGNGLFTEFYDHAEGQKTGYLNASRNNLIATARMGEWQLIGVSLGTYWRRDSFVHMADHFNAAFNDLKNDAAPSATHRKFYETCPTPNA